MKEVLKRIFKKLGYRVVNINSTERDAFKDQAKLIVQKKLTIFDVGACTGEITIKYHELFRNSTIYAFEPFTPSFEMLKTVTSSYKNIQCYNIALSDTTGKVGFHVNQYYPTNSMATHPDSLKTGTIKFMLLYKKYKLTLLRWMILFPQIKLIKLIF